MTITTKDQALLEKFIVDNEELEELESKLAQFNIFEAIGVVRQEIRHSNFLAFLLNPSQNHRLDDIFLKRFLKRVLLETDKPKDEEYANISAVDIDIADLKDAEVRREWQNIDILIQSPRHQLVCAIENKVDSGEHSNQLQRYREIVELEYSNYRKILIYLTPETDKVSDENWRIYTYSNVAEIIDNICNNYKSTIGTDVYTLINHYSILIKRHIMTDSEIAELCRKIYGKHKQALDLIFEHRPDLQLEMADNIIKLASQYITSKKIFLDRYSKKYLGFGSQEWRDKNLPLAFHFENGSAYLVIRLLICPYDNKNIRERIHQVSRDNPQIFKKSNWAEKWITIYQKEILNQKDYDDADVEKLMKKVQDFWENFIKDDFVKIENIIHENIDKLIISDISVETKA
ncbi:PD-(D/E)XK nuclease family protein [Tolypothrix sp. PCC 7910]|uniref:PDDEXK-like family protein n=1 Tax=Tolypothrix sp. PCC 7910 TaxID=2099387 RepID=UPI0014279CB5|nr:PD-(D/E)XK nuclease family protein [Tolypothrix sp. PCC 7910]QIR40038.1 PD-(D/E)XK nuclease family protein [Tolypothrix sp. PCC 7910]